MNKEKNLLSYVGIGMLLLAFILAALITGITGSEGLVENIIMTILLAVATVITIAGYLTIAIIVAAAATVVYAGLKVYTVFALSKPLTPITLLWVILPAMAVVGISLYIKRYNPMTLENALLKKQIAELVMIDPITGFYNLRSLFMDIQTQISYAERNDKNLFYLYVNV